MEEEVGGGQKSPAEFGKCFQVSKQRVEAFCLSSCLVYFLQKKGKPGLHQKQHSQQD